MLLEPVSLDDRGVVDAVGNGCVHREKREDSSSCTFLKTRGVTLKNLSDPESSELACSRGVTDVGGNGHVRREKIEDSGSHMFLMTRE